MNRDEQGEALLAAILDEPADGLPRLAYADWLEEGSEERRAEALRHGVIKRFGVDFHSPGGALTLNPGHLGTHGGQDGWTIEGEVHEDYYEWVNDFEARHPTYGLVWGNFEGLVFASSEEGFRHFATHHEPDAWDYDDI